MKLFLSFGFLSASLICTAFTGDKDKVKKYVIDPKTGVHYRFIKHDKVGAKPADKDVATVIMVYHNDKDSLIFDSRIAPNRKRTDTMGVVQIPLVKSFNGCLEQGIELMAQGDSAEFLINTDSLFTKTFHQKSLPAYVHSGTNLTFNIKLVKFQSQEQMKEEQQQLMVKKQMEIAQRKAEEGKVISKYLSDNNFKVQPTADSLYFLSRQNGTGRQIQEGDSISALYTGMFLDGKTFDASSMHGNKPLTMVYSPNMPLIKGWVLAFGSMREGDKVRILLPSALGYGARGTGPIGPFTPLLFDIEVVKVTAPK
jgi:FKBP-type peptidyl-prolyl cis-trans isomerase FkpA